MKFFGLGAAIAALTMSSMAFAQNYPAPEPQYPNYGPPPSQYQYPPQQQPQGYQQPPQYNAPPAQYTPPPAQYAPSPPPVQAAPQLGTNQNGFQQTGRRMSLTDKLAQRSQNGFHGGTTVINIAVGDAGNANSKIVFPAIAVVAPSSLSLHADPSIGSAESATGVCLGIDAAAVAQLDAILSRVSTPLEEQYQSDDERAPSNCGAEISSTFISLYPQVGYLIVNKDSGYSSMHALLHESGRTKVLAVGLDGSGGAITLKYLLKSSDNRWHATTQPIYGADALTALENHQVDGYFVMEAPNSPFINDVVNQFDGGGKFKFIAINPYDKFFAMHDGKGRRVYQEMDLPGGGFWTGHTASISVDTVLIVNRRFAQGNQGAVRALNSAAERAIPDIRSQTNTPDSWTPASRLQ